MSEGTRPTTFELATRATEAAEARARDLALAPSRRVTRDDDIDAIAEMQAAAADAAPVLREVKLTAASAIQVRPVRWLLSDRLALGSLALLGGREGIGKSLVAIALAGDITRGRLRGQYEGQPKSVIVAATEDSWEHTIIPRLLAAGADLDRVYRVDVTTVLGVDTGLSLPRDLPALEEAVHKVDAALILLDPLMSRLDSKLDSHKDAEVRIALEPLTALADRTDATVLGLIHVNKSSSTDPLTTLMASRAFAAVARAVLFVMTDPDNEATRLLGQPKNNLGRTDLPSLTFAIESAHVADTDEGPVWTGRVNWTGERDQSIREALEAAGETADARSATSEAADWLRDYLTEQGGTDDSASIKAEGRKADHSPDALKRARSRVKATIRAEGFPRRTYWTLPGSTPQPARDSGSESLESHPTAPTAPTGETSLSAHTHYPRSDPVGAVGAVGAVGDGPPAREDGAPTADEPSRWDQLFDGDIAVLSVPLCRTRTTTEIPAGCPSCLSPLDEPPAAGCGCVDLHGEVA